MKKILTFIFIISILLTSACGISPVLVAETAANEQNDSTSISDKATPDSAAISALSDWILGTSFGITSGSIDMSAKSVILVISAEKLAALTDQDKRDISSAVYDILTAHLSPSAVAQEYSIVYDTDSETVIGSNGQTADGAAAPTDQTSETVSDGSAINLIFIHHSVGENWLNDGLCQILNDSGYHVADIYFGWREYGDNTDTVHWPVWFTDAVMDLVYQEMNTMTAPNSIAAADGENTVIMFKSCFPNSDVGSDISDEKAIYNSLLPYMQQHPDKMFVLCTPPPMINISDPAKTREICNWLADRENGWLSGLSTGNVFVFDFYNVLTHPDAHHRLINGEEIHESVAGADTLYYDSAGDDHPNAEGSTKAAQEFIGLLNQWYQSFLALQN